jgi:hypothetical protein
MLMRDCLPLVAPIATFEGWKPAERQRIGWLLTACARSTESALLLVAYAQVWDAEMLARSVLEGVLKLCYLLQDRNAFEKRFEEYFHDLFQLALYKDHKKMADLLAAVPNPEAAEWTPIRDRLLKEEEIDEIEQSYPRPLRRSLETKWGFTGLIRELERSGDALFKGFPGLAFSYSTGSHQLHADYMGVLLPFERDLRAQDRRDALHRAHAVHLISDLFTALWLRLQVGYRFVDTNPAPIFDAMKKFDSFHASLGDIYDQWLHKEYGETS